MKKLSMALLFVLLFTGTAKAEYNPCDRPGLEPPTFVSYGTVAVLYKVCIEKSSGEVTSAWTNMYPWYLNYWSPQVETLYWDKEIQTSYSTLYGGVAMSAMLSIANRYAATGELNGWRGIWSSMNALTNWLRGISIELTAVSHSKVATTQFLDQQFTIVNAELAQRPADVVLQQRRTLIVAASAAVAVTP